MVDSLAEFAALAKKDGQTITLVAGDYELGDFLTPEVIKRKRRRKDFPLIEFSGSNNTFNLDGVTIRYQTEIRSSLRPPAHQAEFVISGNNNTLTGLKILCKGEGHSPGGALIAIEGENNTLSKARLLCQGSYPYGYGDLFGKGGGAIVIRHRKESCLLITGDGTQIRGCHLVMRSFGHGIFLQKDAADVLIEGCQVEGQMRSTTEMLRERGTVAHEKKFRTVIRNREGKNRILPGYMKSLSEDAFRTYSEHHPNLVIRNCQATNMRGGFEIRCKDSATLENCSAIGCERGFWVSSGAVLKNCSGDTRFGPLLYTEGSGIDAELTLLPGKSSSIVHRIAAIHGKDHKISLKAHQGRQRVEAKPIELGFSSPPAGENMSGYGEKDSTGIILRNETQMPVIVGSKAKDCRIESKGPISKNKGKRIEIL